MTKKALMLLALAAGPLSGCRAAAQLSDDQLAAYVQAGSSAAVEFGLKFAEGKEPDRAQQIAADAAAADAVIKADILGPSGVFAGTSGQVLASAAQTALSMLSDKVSPTVGVIVQTALAVLTANVALPDNPAGALDDRTRKALVALFTGISQGIEAVPPPAAGATPTARRAPARLAWPKGNK